MGVREIAREIGRSPSTISRELRRNAATRSGRLDYRASVAQWHAEQRAKRPKAAKLASTTGCVSTWPSVWPERCAGPTVRRCPDR
jgi:IS30 family transposase